MPYKKEILPSTCTFTSRRDLEKLTIKDLAQAKSESSPIVRIPCPSTLDQYVSDRDDYNPGVYPNTVCAHHQQTECSGTCPKGQCPADKITICLSRYPEVEAIIDKIQHCRDTIGAIAEEAKNIISVASEILSGCSCNRKGKTNNENKAKLKKSDSLNLKEKECSGNCCNPSWLLNDRNSDKDVKQKNKKLLKSNSKNSRQEKNEKESCGEDSCCVCVSPRDLDNCHCGENKKSTPKSQNKIVNKKSDTPSSVKTGKTSRDKYTSSTPPTEVECSCEKEMAKRKKKMEKADSKTSSHEKKEKRSSVTPKDLDDFSYDGNIAEQNTKVKMPECENSCHERIRKKPSDKYTCYTPLIENEPCTCDKQIAPRNKNIEKADSKNSRKEKVDKITFEKSTNFNTPMNIEYCTCKKEMTTRNKKVQKSERKKSHKGKNEKINSDKNTTTQDVRMSRDEETYVVLSSDQPSRAANRSCNCCFPPEYSQNFGCTDRLNCNCHCKKENN